MAFSLLLPLKEIQVAQAQRRVLRLGHLDRGSQTFEAEEGCKQNSHHTVISFGKLAVRLEHEIMTANPSGRTAAGPQTHQ